MRPGFGGAEPGVEPLEQRAHRRQRDAHLCLRERGLDDEERDGGERVQRDDAGDTVTDELPIEGADRERSRLAREPDEPVLLQPSTRDRREGRPHGIGSSRVEDLRAGDRELEGRAPARCGEGKPGTRRATRRGGPELGPGSSPWTGGLG